MRITGPASRPAEVLASGLCVSPLPEPEHGRSFHAARTRSPAASHRPGQLPRLDARCLRLLPVDLRHRQRRQRIPRCEQRGHLRPAADPDGAAAGRADLRPAGRPLRAAAGADAGRDPVLGVRTGHRLRTHARHAAGAALPVRHRDGRRMGHRRLAGDGVDPAQGARRGVGPAAERLPLRLLPRRAGELATGGPHRLARAVRGRRAAGAAGALHPPQGARVAGVAGAPARAGQARPGRGDARALEAGAVPDAADGRVQHVQPRLAGHVPHLRRGGPRPQDGLGRGLRAGGAAQPRRAGWRACSSAPGPSASGGGGR